MNDPFDTLVMNSKPLGEGVSCREELISLLKSHPELETTKLYHKRLFEPKRIPAFSLSVYESDEDNRPLSYIVRYKQQLDIGKTLGDCLVIPAKEATKVCHFVTFSDINQEQEETSLQTIFEVKVLDKTGRLTPDFHVDSGTIDIVEFATSASKHQQALVNTFNNKFVKYYDAVRLHSMNSGRNSRLFVIVVGREGLLSSLNLSDPLVSELIFRYRFSRAIAAKFSEIGVHQSHFDEDEGINYKNAKAMFESMDFDFDESGEWTKVNYENWISEITQFEIHNISKNIMHCFKEASDTVNKEEVMRSKPKIFLNSFADESIKEFEDAHFMNGNTRKDLKPITIFPLFIPKTRSYYSSYDFKSIILNITGTDTMSMAWKMAIESAKTSENYQFEESITSSASTYINGCSYDLKNRALYKRVKLDLCESEWEDLATKGIRGKEFSKSSKYQEALAHSKGGFATSVDTSDIDDFLNSKELFDNHDSHPGYIDTLIDLIKRANVMAENDICTFSKDIVKTFDNFSRTGYFRYMCMITEIACELLMTLRQNCKKDQFVLKTLKFSNVLLLIRPTNSTEHIFFSLMSEVGDESVVHGLPFGRMNKSENLIYTDFVSANSQQLSHWAISAPMSLVFLQVWMKYCDMQYCQFLEKDSFLNVDSEFSKMMNLSMLIFLEQKASTEEVLTLFRYGSMECFKDKPGFCNPLKILDKMPTMFRSRLTSWAYKKLIIEMKSLTGKGYKQVKNDAVKAKVTKIKTIWKNLRNPYTESRVSDPSKLVNLFYLGYLRNKHTKTNSNQDLALISKILKGEKEYLTAIDRDSLGSCYFSPEFKHNPHNYDVGFCKVLTAYLKRGYHMRTGESISSVIEKEFITSLINHSPDVFMTLKASSSFKPGDEDLLLGEVKKAAKVKSKRSRNIEPCTVFDVQDTLLSDADVMKDDKVMEEKPEVRINTSRPRVIEEFSDVVKDYDPVIMFLPNAIKVCSEHGLMIDIFKKPQQGGLREIYVLTRESRMVQFTIEHLSRIICSTFESETMTHPKNKIRLMTDHGALARKKTEDIIQDYEKRVKNKSSFCIINSNSSKDKKSWNNTNSPSKFAIMLLRLTPRMFHPFIFNSLKLWDRKQMLLPTGIQNILIKGLKWEIKDPIMNEFFKSYNQESSCFSETIHKSKPYITVKTGMMQGILHFTSSLMHTGFNLFVKSMFFGNCKKFSWIHDSIFTHLESSDDSAYLRTMWVDSKRRREALRFMYVNELFTTKICKLAGFHESMQKSSHHSSRVVEFNSEFCFDDQVYKPDMKFAFVCLRIPENESLSESCYQYKCLSSACLESGTTILGVHIIQIAQAFTHYLTLGLTLNPLFKPFSKHLIATTDPGIGFFPLDPCMLSGIVDHQFNVWMLLKGNPVFSMKTSTLLNTEKISSYSGGTLLKSAVLMFGDRRRWRSIINRMEDRIGHVDYREFVSKNPHLLFLRPSTSEERVAYQFLKMYTPSIISSLGNVGRMDRMLIRGGYAIQHKCLTLGSLWTDLLDNSNKESLSSLVRQLCNMVIKFIDNEQDIILNDEETDMIKTFREFISLDNEQNLHLLSEFDFDALRRDHSTAINSSIIRLADQRKIFPQLSDYISLLSNHRALCNSNWSIWDNKEKKRATVPVFEAPVQDLLSLENLCVYKWFNVIKHKLPESVITAQWNIFKAKYEWLRDTFQESFHASNFENEVSFANFIKMQLGKTRRMFVCSAPLKIEDGHSAIYSLMSRHFWPNMLLKALDSSKVLNKTSKDLIHPLATISTLKMSSQHRIDVYKSLTETHEEYKNLMNEFIDNNVSSSRELKLQPIIRLMRGDPKEIIDTCILRSKMGIVGSWVKQERFDRNTKRYSGKGLWEGRIDDLMLSVHTENARVTRMEASSGALFRLMFGAIRNWMREVRIDFADSYHIGNSEVERVIACIRNNDIHDMITDKMCTPVFKSDKILSPNLESYSNYSINITNHSVQLRADMRRFVVEDEFSDNVTVLAVRLYDSDFLSNPMDYNFSGDILLSHLLSNRPFGVRKESLIEPQQLVVNTGVRRQNVVINTTKVVPFWEVSSCDNYTIGEFIKSFNDSIAETRRYDKEDLMKRLMDVYKFAIEAREIGDRFPSQILCKLLPSGFDYATNKNGLEFLRSLIPQLIREQRFRTQSVFPELLHKKALTSWSKVMSHTHLLDSEDILACITSLTGKPTVLIEKRALKWEVVLYAGGHLKDQLSRQLDSSNIIISCLDASSRLHSTHLLRRSGPKVISYNKRLVKASSNVDPSKVSWDNIRSDLQAVRQLIHQNPGCIYNVRELKNQLQMWLCRSFYDAGLMSQGFIHDLTNVEWDTDEYVSERVMAPDAAEKEDDKTEDIGQDEDFDFNDEFDEFLESEDAEAYQEMFVGEIENNSYESDDSLDNLALDETHTKELHKYVSEFERHVKMSIPNASLFDVVVAKLQKDFRGFFSDPNSNLVRHGVPTELFNVINYFMGGRLVMEQFDSHGW